MNRNTWMLAVPVRWKVLEEFYAGVEGGPEKVEKMKRLCADADSLEGERLRQSEVNLEYLGDRRRKLNAEFERTGENIWKLIQLDKRLRELEREIGENFARIKRDLDDLVAQGGDVYKDYQVEAWIDYMPDDCDDEDCKPSENAWTQGLLERYLDGKMTEIVSFGDGQEPDRNEAFEAWGRWTEYEYFAENGMTRYLCHLLETSSISLYSPSDVVEMKPEDFRARYEVSF